MHHFHQVNKFLLDIFLCQIHLVVTMTNNHACVRSNSCVMSTNRGGQSVSVSTNRVQMKMDSSEQA